MYFSGLYEDVNYIAPYPKHTAGQYPTVLESPLTRFAKCFRGNYLADLVIRHTTAPESKTNRAGACHANQLNTIHINRAPQKKPGEPYKSFPVKKGKTVVVLDDIMTEGYSLDAARLYLGQTGAKVICVSLLKTINRPYCHVPSVSLPKGAFLPNQIKPQSLASVTRYPFQTYVSDALAATDLSARLKRYKSWDANWPP